MFWSTQFHFFMLLRQKKQQFQFTPSYYDSARRAESFSTDEENFWPVGIFRTVSGVRPEKGPTSVLVFLKQNDIFDHFFDSDS